MIIVRKVLQQWFRSRNSSVVLHKLIRRVRWLFALTLLNSRIKRRGMHDTHKSFEKKAKINLVKLEICFHKNFPQHCSNLFFRVITTVTIESIRKMRFLNRFVVMELPTCIFNCSNFIFEANTSQFLRAGRGILFFSKLISSEQMPVPYYCSENPYNCTCYFYFFKCSVISFSNGYGFFFFHFLFTIAQAARGRYNCVRM